MAGRVCSPTGEGKHRLPTGFYPTAAMPEELWAAAALPVGSSPWCVDASSVGIPVSDSLGAATMAPLSNTAEILVPR